MALSLIPLNPDLYPPGSFLIPGESVTFRVGREGSNDLQVNHSSVSAQHARIETIDGASVDVVDCGSTNGTFVNGIRVERMQLVPGDLLRFATAEFRVTSEPTPSLNGSAGSDGATKTVNLSQLGSPGPQPNSLERERNQLRTEVERMTAEVSEINGYLQEWQSGVATRDEEIANLSASLNAHMAGSREQVAALEAEIAGLSHTIQELEKANQSLAATHAAEIAALSARLKEREEAFVSLSENSGKEIQLLTRNLAERETELTALKAKSSDEILALNDRLKVGEEDYSKLSRDREEQAKDLNRIIGERDAALREIAAKRETEVASLSEKLAGQEELCRQLKRELEDHIQREQRNLSQISETRKELMDRESRIAALHYEVSARDGSILQLNNQRQQLQQGNDLSLAEIGRLQDSLNSEKQSRLAAHEAQQLAEANAENILRRLIELGDRLSADWSSWLPAGEEHSAPRDADEIFSRIASLAGRIRNELDLIEPVWQKFGDHVQEELAARCGAFREEESELTREILDRQSELVSLKADLDQFRELIDVEVRRAQGLSRRGTEIEIPERFESMVIAKDREQEIYRALVDRLEVLDRLLEEYRGSRKLREVTKELTEFRSRLAEILAVGGVEAFQVESGTFLSLKQRKEVQVVSRKGWGTSQYSEYPFQPGEVVKVVRPGYRAGSGEHAIILRKVEVLIRGVDA